MNPAARQAALRTELEERGILAFSESVAFRYGLTLDEVFSPEREPSKVEARRDIAEFLRDKYKMSYPMIGRVLRRDHTSVMYLLKTRGPKVRVDA